MEENRLTLEEALEQVSYVTISRGNGRLVGEILEAMGLNDEETRDLLLRDTDDFLHSFPDLKKYPLNIILPSYGIHMLLTGIIWGSNNPNAVTIEKEAK